MMPLYVYTHSQNITSPFYDNRYCRDACFKRCWDDHTRLHQQQAKADLEQQQAEKQFKRGSKLNDGDVDDDEIKPTAASIEVDGNNAIADAMHDDGLLAQMRSEVTLIQEAGEGLPQGGADEAPLKRLSIRICDEGGQLRA